MGFGITPKRVAKNVIVINQVLLTMYVILQPDIVIVNLESEVNTVINVYQTTMDFHYWVARVI